MSLAHAHAGEALPDHEADLVVAGPPIPETLADTGLSEEDVTSLCLKALYVHGAGTGRRVSETLCLPFSILDDLLLSLQQRRQIEVLRTEGHGREGYVYDLTDLGRDRAHQALEASRYVGPAPVPLEQYRAQSERQSIRRMRVSRELIRGAFRDLVLSPTVTEALGPALSGGRSIFLHGEPGNGKTAIAERVTNLVGGAIFVPHAIVVDGDVIVFHDPVHHHPVAGASPEGRDRGPVLVREAPTHDQRWVRIRRPSVFVGGELTLDQLDLRYDPYSKFYQAPVQLKANGGVLIIDDFGRQLVRPADLLNRWIVPLEKDRDYLNLHTGVKFPVPFDTLLIFATNLQPQDLVDEAFLRRIHYKIEVGDPGRADYEEIFRRVCEDRDVEYDDRAVDQIYRTFYEGLGIPPRGCHARDIVGHVQSIARYEGAPPDLSPEFVERACRSYFLIMNHDALTAEGTEQRR